MAPVVVDLTSSPEPEREVAPNLCIFRRDGSEARTWSFCSTEPFHPSDEDDSADEGAASAALKYFQPRKQKERPNQSNTGESTGLGGRVPVSSSRVTVEHRTDPSSGLLGSDNANGHYALGTNGTQGVQTKFMLPRSSSTRQEPAAEGSLASLLQRTTPEKAAPKAPPTPYRSPNWPKHKQWLPRPSSSASLEASRKHERISDPIATAGEILPLPEMPSIGQHLDRVDDSQANEHKPDLTLVNLSKSSVDHDDNSPRPFKRRRMDESNGAPPEPLSTARTGLDHNPLRSKDIATSGAPSHVNSQVPSRSATPKDPAVSWPTQASIMQPYVPDDSFLDSPVIQFLLKKKRKLCYVNMKNIGGLLDEYERINGLDTSKRPKKPRTPRAKTHIQAGSEHHPTSSDSSLKPSQLKTDTSEESKTTEKKPPQISDKTIGFPVSQTSSALGPLTAADDELLIRLKEVDKLSWKEIASHFPRRTQGSLQVRYCTKLNPKLKANLKENEPLKPHIEQLQVLSTTARDEISKSPSPSGGSLPKRTRKRRNNDTSAVDGFISWAEVKKSRLDEDRESDAKEGKLPEKSVNSTPQFQDERAHPQSMLRILRQREIGSDHGRTWTSSTRSIADQLKEHVFDSAGPTKYFKGTSGDVTCLAWAPGGSSFAAGSIAISDERSMQYNRPCNLLLGDCRQGLLQELPEHHVPRPTVQVDDGNVNALHSMRETQDPRLFMTVASVQFSPDSTIMYSAGSDCKVRAYSTDTTSASCQYKLHHPAPVELLSVGNTGVLATACHQSLDGNINVYRGQQHMLSLSPSRVEQQTDRAIYPSAMKWGAAAHHTNLLLTGFSIGSVDEERNIAGETCLWDVAVEARIKINGVTRNVFDVAWNPRPSPASTIFAVASVRGAEKLGKSTRTVVQCFAPSQNKAVRVLEWECPAFDINDVLYCEHDTNLIAAGATDGKVYVWDQRFANRSHAPLHVLAHGDTVNVLDHDREREIADTGVRLISWGATSSRLYSGSSDGTVKVWNPYRSSEDAHVKDVALFSSAVMSGAFSPDYRDLLIGEDQGRINLLSVGHEDKAVRTMQRFRLQNAPPPVTQDNPFIEAQELLDSDQIVIRPIGNLQKRQAVQGPNYRGPYYAPSEGAMEHANEEYRLARLEQKSARSRAATSPSDDSEDEQTLQKAKKRVQDAKAEIKRMKLVLNEAELLYPQAESKQAEFRRQSRALLHGDVQRCALDCSYISPNSNDFDRVPDSRRSEARIPIALLSKSPLDTADMVREDLLDAGLTYKCMSCLGPARKPTRGKMALCEACACTRNGLTASCERCSVPIRAGSNDSGSKLCEKCNFGCFRCAKRANVSLDGQSITCVHCGLTWEAAVLGYELSTGTPILPLQQRGASKQDQLAAPNGEEGIGDLEIERLASLWL